MKTMALLYMAVLMVMMSLTTRGCPCIPGHDQHKICAADNVMKVKIMEQIIQTDGSDNLFIVEIKKIFKDPSNAFVEGNWAVFASCSNSSCCGIDHTMFNSSDAWVFGGSVDPVTHVVHIDQCGYHAGDFKAKIIDKYLENCDCEIAFCEDCEQCQNESNECKYIYEETCRKGCYDDYGTCKKLKNSPASTCMWRGNDEFDTCLENCGLSCPANTLEIEG